VFAIYIVISDIHRGICRTDARAHTHTYTSLIKIPESQCQLYAPSSVVCFALLTSESNFIFYLCQLIYKLTFHSIKFRYSKFNLLKNVNNSKIATVKVPG
jgi:hypothetical protein